MSLAGETEKTLDLSHHGYRFLGCQSAIEGVVVPFPFHKVFRGILTSLKTFWNATWTLIPSIALWQASKQWPWCDKSSFFFRFSNQHHSPPLPSPNQRSWTEINGVTNKLYYLASHIPSFMTLTRFIFLLLQILWSMSLVRESEKKASWPSLLGSPNGNGRD